MSNALSPALKAQILSAMGQVQHEGIAGYAIRKFALESHLKRDDEVIEAVENIKCQIVDNPMCMRRVLGDQFEFLNALPFNPKYTAAGASKSNQTGLVSAAVNSVL